MMKIRQSKNLINRVKYKEIKKYDHRQLEEFLRVFYMEAYKEGQKDAEPKINGVAELLNGLDNGECKGIGGATAKKIREFVKEKGLV